MGVGGSLAAESSIMVGGGLGSARAGRDAPSRQTTGTTSLLGHQEIEKQKCSLYASPPTHTRAHTRGQERWWLSLSSATQPRPPRPDSPAVRAGMRGDVSPRGGLSLAAGRGSILWRRRLGGGSEACAQLPLSGKGVSCAVAPMPPRAISKQASSVCSERLIPFLRVFSGREAHPPNQRLRSSESEDTCTQGSELLGMPLTQTWHVSTQDKTPARISMP